VMPTRSWGVSPQPKTGGRNRCTTLQGRLSVTCIATTLSQVKGSYGSFASVEATPTHDCFVRIAVTRTPRRVPLFRKGSPAKRNEMARTASVGTPVRRRGRTRRRAGRAVPARFAGAGARSPNPHSTIPPGPTGWTALPPEPVRVNRVLRQVSKLLTENVMCLKQNDCPVPSRVTPSEFHGRVALRSRA